jgi:hypothetical protein
MQVLGWAWERKEGSVEISGARLSESAALEKAERRGKVSPAGFPIEFSDTGPPCDGGVRIWVATARQPVIGECGVYTAVCRGPKRAEMVCL